MSVALEVDPFKGVATQTQRYRAHCRIWVNGLDVTDRLEPHLISVRIKDESPLVAEIELDDRDARLPAPPLNAKVIIELGWASERMTRMFNGSIDTQAESAFGRKQGGRRMFIHAAGANWLSDIKTPFQDGLGTGPDPGTQQGSQQHPVTDWLQQVAKNGGGTAQIDPAFGNVQRDHWAQTNASPVQVFQQLAGELGGMFRVDSGNRFVFAKPGSGFIGSTGGSDTGVVARWGDNLISWRIQMNEARSMWQGANQQFYDTAKAVWDKVAGQGTGVGGGGGGVQALPAPAPNSGVAQQQTDGMQGSVTPTTGTLVMNGEPAAQWGGKVQVIGARPGVDGLYGISSAEHFYSRQGYITTLKIWRGGAGGAAGGSGSGRD